MAYAFDAVKVLVAGGMLAGCTGINPLFQLNDESATGGGTQQSAGETTSAGPTSEGPTSAGPTSEGTTSEGTTAGVVTSMGPGPATTGATSGGPEETGPSETTGMVVSDSIGETTEGSSSGGIVVGCGNGIIDMNGTEECDEGDMNGEGECSPTCKLNVCGDQYVGPEEACDKGANNGPGSECTEACTINKCGDGLEAGDEVCDKGPKNGQEHPGCSHDCKAQVVQKRNICMTPAEITGKLAYDNKLGLAGADAWCLAKCGVNMKAMIVGEGRVASKSAYAGKQASWVVAPYTAYYSWKGPLVFITGAEGLLGVVDGADAPLLAAIGNSVAWTGLNADWTESGDNCGDWTTKDGNTVATVGSSSAMTQGLYVSKGQQSCALMAAVYCVEQL